MPLLGLQSRAQAIQIHEAPFTEQEIILALDRGEEVIRAPGLIGSRGCRSVEGRWLKEK